MGTKLVGWATAVLTLVGVVLIGAFFGSWIIDGTSGLSIAWHHEHWLFLVPISGALLVATAASKSSHTRMMAVAAGLLVAGSLVYQMLRGVLHGGFDLWLMLGGAIAVLAGVANNKGLRVFGSVAILAGFFAPWASESMFRGLTGEGAALADAIGINVKVLWLIPVAGIAAMLSGALAGTKGRHIAIASGLAVFGSILWMIGSFANLIFAWGAWATLGASATALVLGVLAPNDAASKPAAKA